MCKAEKVVNALKTCVPTKCNAEEIAKFEPTINSACKGKLPALNSYLLVPHTNFNAGNPGYPMKLGKGAK